MNQKIIRKKRDNQSKGPVCKNEVISTSDSASKLNQKIGINIPKLGYQKSVHN